MPSDFKEKFIVTANYIPAPSRRRSGRPTDPVKFIVVHDTGNPDSTAAANVRFYINTCQTVDPKKTASAHIFVDDKEIIECIPALTATPEKAWHVLYSKPKDNELFGADANDAAIGVEYCYGKKIDADKAYRKFVWVVAKLCHHFNLDPAKKIVGHFFLDPERKTDPVTGLAFSRRSYDQLLSDIVKEYTECTQTPGALLPPDIPIETVDGTARAIAKLNIRKSPSRLAEKVQQVAAGTLLPFVGIVRNGESINNNPVWYKDSNAAYFWSGGTDKIL
jgi:N-acetylmuramoyl-L-alanine amidase